MQNDNSASAFDQKKGERLTPRELFQKHLKDPDHHVTDEELRNLIVGTDAEDEAQVDKEADSLKKEVDNSPTDDTLPNPYKVIS